MFGALRVGRSVSPLRTLRGNAEGGLKGKSAPLPSGSLLPPPGAPPSRISCLPLLVHEVPLFLHECPLPSMPLFPSTKFYEK